MAEWAIFLAVVGFGTCITYYLSDIRARLVWFAGWCDRYAHVAREHWTEMERVLPPHTGTPLSEMIAAAEQARRASTDDNSENKEQQI